MILKNQIWAFIPARSGSKSIKDKNIKNFCGKPLIYYSLKILEKIKVQKIIFSTDSVKYVKIAEKFGQFEVHRRSKKNSRDKSTDLEVFGEFIKSKKKLPEFFLHLRPTTPFRRPEIINKAIRLFKKKKEKFSSLRSISKLSNTGYRSLIIKKGILHSMHNNDPFLDRLNIARQNFQDTYIANGYVDIIKTKTLLKKNIHGRNVYPFLTLDFNSDIDTLEDFKNNELILKKNDYFKKYFFNR